jgi:hypothetical protein
MGALRVTLTLPGVGSRTVDLAPGRSATVGAAAPANILLDTKDPEVAAVHVRLSVTDRGLEVFQEAPAGFAVNGRKAKRAALKDGDVLQIGASAALKVGVAPVPASAVVPPPGPARTGERPVVVLDKPAPGSAPPPLVSSAPAAMAGAAGVGAAGQALAAATASPTLTPQGTAPPPPPPPQVGAHVVSANSSFVVVDALAPPPLHDPDREKDKSKSGKIVEARRAAELMYGTPMRGSALAQQIAAERPDAGLSLHVAPLAGSPGSESGPISVDRQGAHRGSTGSQKVTAAGAPVAHPAEPYKPGELSGHSRVLRGAAALAAVPGAAKALGGQIPGVHAPQPGHHSQAAHHPPAAHPTAAHAHPAERPPAAGRGIPPRTEPAALEGGAPVIGGATTGEDLLHLLLFVESRHKTGTLVARVPGAIGIAPVEGRLAFRNGAVAAPVPASLDDPALAWLVPAATAPLIEFRFVFTPPPRIDGEVATKMSALIEQLVRRLQGGR